MAVFTEESAKANVRNLDGKRVFFLAEGNHLTPSAREWLRKEHIEILSGPVPANPEYRTIAGALLKEKPEHMTHLRTGVLVDKTHPRIRFRGGIDSLEACLLLTGQQALSEGRKAMVGQLQELLDTVRNMIRCEVLEEPITCKQLCGYTMDQLREFSHRPELHFEQPHFMPSFTDRKLLLDLNSLRTQLRQTELLACEAFQDRDGGITRRDLIQLLNRMSSLIWIMMIQLKKEETNDHRT